MFNSLNDHFDKHCQTNTVRWVLISLLHGFPTHPEQASVLWPFPQFGFRTFQDETNLCPLMCSTSSWVQGAGFLCLGLFSFTPLPSPYHLNQRQMNILSTVHMLGSTAYHSRHERMPLIFYHFMLVQGFSISWTVISACPQKWGCCVSAGRVCIGWFRHTQNQKGPCPAPKGQHPVPIWPISH